MAKSPDQEASDSCSGSDKSDSVECRLCGQCFKNNLGVSTHFRYKHPNEHRIPKDKLVKLYSDGLSMREIAEQLDTSKGSIQIAFDKYDIDARASYRDDEYPPRHRFDKISGSIGHEYEVMETSINNNSYSFFVHRLIAVAEGLLDPSDFRDFDTVVHHKSEHGLDNRPNNLKVMERGEHQSMHVKERRG
ncbi:hypothetical protein OSG_eHP15_00185 [environmental Halophage eHP-15]|nr:hypothetical protein OSG_eHP15_00185 [environmental Halophage eHP-15]